MKKSLLILAILLISNSVLAQEYDPVLKEGTFWDIERYVSAEIYCMTNITRYQIENDTIINNKTYKKIKQYTVKGNNYFHDLCVSPPYYIDTNEFIYLNSFVREDIEERKLYLLSNNFSEDYNYQEYIICDFNLEVGDVIENYLGKGEDLTLESKSLVDGKMRYNLYGDRSESATAYIEGSGPIYPINNPIDICYMVLDSDCTNLFCFGNNENQNNCNITLSTNEYLNNNTIKIYPNPSEDNLTIDNLSLKSTIKIYSTQGQLLKQLTTENSNTSIDVSNLTRGIYIIKFSSSSFKNNKTLKFTKQ